MVCKENVVSWFGNLSSYKRIDVMNVLLNMCLPCEVRYLGTCIEDRGKRDYNDLRDAEHHANTVSDLTDLMNLGVIDKKTRRRLVLYMALLHGSNYKCATVLHKGLANLDIQEIISLIGTSQDEQLLEELLLLYTMALNHPAFNYEQKSAFSNIYLKLQEEEESRNNLKPVVNMSYKPVPGCGPCGSPSDRLTDPIDMSTNCTIPPPMQHFGDIQMRNNPIVSGIPSSMTMPPPPPGMCLPPPDQITMNPPNTPTQYLHLGFPAVNSIAPWSGQTMMIGNQMVYHTGDMVTYPASPLVSRPSSPSQSRSPSRSNSPLGRRNNRWPFEDRSSIGPTTPMTPNTISVSSNVSSNQTSVTNTNVSGHILPGSSLGTNRNIPSSQQSVLPPKSVPPPSSSPLTTTGTYSRHSNVDNTTTAATQATSSKHQPLSRIRSSISGDSLRETLGKEMPNYKGNLQNHSLEEIRRMSDDDLRDIGLTPNAVGQLRNIIRTQTTAANGLSQMTIDKKESTTGNLIHSSVSEQSDNETGSDLSNENSISTIKQPLIGDLHQSIHHHHHHHHHHHSHPSNIGGVRRYQAIQPPVDPSQISIYHSPQTAMYATQNPCYACLTVPVAGMQNRYPRCNAQHMYCVAQLSTLRLDADSNRQCSQSSSSDSTGSRSPPETPPAAPWPNNTTPTITNDSCSTSGGTTDQTPGSSVLSYSAVAVSHQNIPSVQQQINERSRSKKSQAQMMRKNQVMNGGGGNGNGSGSNSGNSGGTVAPPPQVNLSTTPHCISAFPGPTNHPQMTFLPHGHFPALRPNSGIYSSGFSHSIFSRPTYQSYQPNGEMMYPYPGQPGAAGGTPPPPPPPLPPPTGTTAVAAVGVAPSQTYLPSTPVVVPHTSAVQPTKISCYNCGSSNHLANECKDQTMEDITKRAQYRLDYSIMKQPGDCPDE
ncbi:sialidase-like isoform X2 [Chelonus insularis]|uniref:sialidase-like isoform X2 n=1 Tax=Chelonus insularis TaxID=460826 RepID=UPI00158D347C|nr:sialidase-like isoform X2 [Chelonus insularis]